MATRITIEKASSGFVVTSPGGAVVKKNTQRAAVRSALEAARLELQMGYTDVEVHVAVRPRPTYVIAGRELLKKIKSELKDTRTKFAPHFQVIIGFWNAEQLIYNVPFSTSFRASDANLLLHVLQQMTPKLRADLAKVSIVQMGGKRSDVPWLANSTEPRRFFFGKEYKERTPRKPKSLLGKIFS